MTASVPSSIIFHCASLPLAQGSVINPGNWGRIKRRFETDAGKIAREAILENIRLREFPSKPSRLEAAFACPDLPTVEAYRASSAVTGLIYEVELVDPTAPLHIGDHVLCMKGYTGIDGMEDIARRYWRGDTNGTIELVTLSPLRIIRCVG